MSSLFGASLDDATYSFDCSGIIFYSKNQQIFFFEFVTTRNGIIEDKFNHKIKIFKGLIININILQSFKTPNSWSIVIIIFNFNFIISTTNNNFFIISNISFNFIFNNFNIIIIIIINCNKICL